VLTCKICWRRAVLSMTRTTPISASSCQGSCFTAEIPCVGICRLSFQHEFQLTGNTRKWCLFQAE
uniref:Uncharacterized protein n=1 Tax=Anas platyrhynchos platyrhynchos TaxID=8840 RepID=A0A493THC9_ANAPP